MSADIGSAPLTCEEIRPMLEPFWRSELDPVAETLVRFHMVECAACQEAYAAVIAPDEESLRVPALPSSGTREDREIRVNRLLEWRQRGEQWAAEALDALRDAFLLARPGYAVPVAGTRGAGADGANQVGATVLDEAWQATAGRVEFQVQDGPRIGKDGRFTLALATPRPQPRLAGWMLLCALTSRSGQKFVFEAPLQASGDGRAEVRFEEPVFDQRSVETPVSLELLEFSLAPVLSS